MDLKIVESPGIEPGNAIIMLAPADFVAYKEYLEKRKELEKDLGIVGNITTLLEDSFFEIGVELKNKT